MTDACCSPSNSPGALNRAKPACPTNQKVGKAIDSITLKALLALPLTQVVDQDYRFCPDPACPTVYYRNDGQQLFIEADLREKVYQKHPDDDQNLICYCFQITVGELRAEMAKTGTSSVVERITAGIQAGQCACDIRNPQGDCCLGNVNRLIQKLRAEKD